MIASTQTSSSSSLWVVGVGASAGGLKALEEFFENMPADSGGAFVVVQHLSPDFKSLMKELLERRTTMPVYRVTDGMALEPNSVFLIPPKNNLTIKNRQLNLTAQPSDRRHYLNFPIDVFFKSLAEDLGKKAIGVILSGTGSDGSRGLQGISNAGGIALVQSPTTAEFDGMPQSAIATGLVDRVLSPCDLAQTIAEITQAPENTKGWDAEEASESPFEPSQLQQIIDILTEGENIDFSQYKPSTICRRIDRRCSLSGFYDLEDYIQHLQNSAEETQLLREDMLIGVTSFFRDSQAWEILEQRILPEIVQQVEPNEQIRIWITACSTGEEAYSMAMLVDEALRKANKALKLKIFATDIDSAALEKASAGIYPKSIASNISPERLQRYFQAQENSFHVKSDLRERLIFAPHNLIKNAGFSKMHLVSCRNVLIYMQSALQQQVLRMLHFSLAPKGILFLGAAETPGDIEDEFEQLDRKWKFYRKQRDIRLFLTPRQMEPLKSVPRPRAQADRHLSVDPVLSASLIAILEDRKATCFLVDENDVLLNLFCDGANVLQLPKGWATPDAIALVPKTLQLPLKTALHRAERERKNIFYGGIKAEYNGKVGSLNLKIFFDQAERQSTDFFMVLIEEETASTQPVAALPDRNFEVNVEAQQRIEELEYELQQMRENLQATIEELETTNEEQQATNEELLASNEELQSTNEELHSVNEELYTVNAEHQSKIQQLAELNHDLDHLLQSTDIGVVFLNRHLAIRKFTPAAASAFNLVDSDIGRPLPHLAHNLNCQDLESLLRQVADCQQPLEREVQQIQSQDTFLLRIHPCHSEEEFDGIVMTLVNINEFKRARDELEYLYDTTPVGLGIVDENLKFVRINQQLADINGKSVEEHIGKTIRDILPELADELEVLYNQVLETGKPIENLEIHGTTPAAPDIERDWTVSYIPLELPGGRQVVESVVSEVTEIKHIQQKLQENQDKLNLALSAAGIALWHWEMESDRWSWDNQTQQRYQTQGQTLPQNYQDWLGCIHPDAQSQVEAEISTLLQDLEKGEIKPHSRVAGDQNNGIQAPSFYDGFS